MLPKMRFELITGAAAPTPLITSPPMSVEDRLRTSSVPPLTLVEVRTANTGAVPVTDVGAFTSTTFATVEPANVLLIGNVPAVVMNPSDASYVTKLAVGSVAEASRRMTGATMPAPEPSPRRLLSVSWPVCVAVDWPRTVELSKRESELGVLPRLPLTPGTIISVPWPLRASVVAVSWVSKPPVASSLR